MAGDYTRVLRLLRLLTCIQAGPPRSSAHFADLFQVVERTIFRDLEVLIELGVPLSHDADAGGYRIRGDYFFPPIQLSPEETLALITLGSKLGGDELIPLMRPAATAIEKLRAQLPDHVLNELGDLDHHIAFDLPPRGSGDGIEDVFLLMQHAIRHRRVLQCCYQSLNRSDDETFLFKPYRLYFGRRAWYAIGLHDGHGAVRLLKLNRFTQTTPTETPYAIPDDFCLDDFFGHAWSMVRGKDRYRVVIDFDAEFVDNVTETRWHRTQQEEPLDDGRVRLMFEVDGLEEIVWWVLAYGNRAKVREPAELACRVAEISKATAALYE